MAAKPGLSWSLVFALTGAIWAASDVNDGNWDSTSVLSQLRPKGQKILREKIQNKFVKRAQIIQLDFDKIENSDVININLFNEGASAFQIIRAEMLPSRDRMLILENHSGRQAIFIVTKTGITGAIFADIHNRHSYNVNHIRDKMHLLTELGDNILPPDYQFQKAMDSVWKSGNYPKRRGLQ